MGKVRKLRQKLHIAAKKEKAQQDVSNDFNITTSPHLTLTPPKDDLFANLNIDFNSLKTKLNDDVQSVKSFKSVKSEKSGTSILPKKEKLKMRRELLMKKIDTVNQMKKELNIRNKRKKTAIMGDTNPLHDALPSLELLLKNRPNIKQNISVETKKKRGIEKAKKRRKEVVQGVQLFESVFKNKTFQSNPLETITQHVQALVNQEREKVKK